MRRHDRGTHTSCPPARLPPAVSIAAAASLAAAGAHAQPRQAREEILGYDPATSTLAYVERAPSPLAGFTHTTLVEAPANGAPRRIRLTTDEDTNQLRAATQPRTRETNRAAIEARVARDVDAARARFVAGSVIPVTERASGAGSSGACTRPPFGPREFALGDGVVARVTVAADGSSAQLVMTQGGRAGAPTELPSVALSYGGSTTRAPYNRVADAREIPGVEPLAVLVRTDACTPEGAAVPAMAVMVAPPPPPERPLAPLAHAELAEAAVVRALAPRARRRTVDEVSGYFEGRARVVFDNAWSVGSGGDRVLVQYARREADLPPSVGDAGQAPARFALVSRQGGGRLRVLSQLAPPVGENVFEGTGQEAFAADLDGDGAPEIVVRSRHQPDGEVTSVLRVVDDGLQFVWRGTTRADERAGGTAAQPEVRRCNVGLDGQVLVVRCQLERHRAGAPQGAQPVSRARLVQRLRWNGGALQLTEERR